MTKLSELYCEGCGERLVNKFIFNHFDKETGQPLYTVSSKCPNHHSWWDKHDSYTRRTIYAGEMGHVGTNTLFYEDGEEA